MHIQIWNRVIQFENQPDVKIVEKFNLSLLKSVLEAKKVAKMGKIDNQDEWKSASWGETLFLYSLATMGLILFGIGVMAIWWMIIEEAVR